MGSYTTDVTNEMSVQTSGMLRLTEVTPAQIDIHSRVIYKFYRALYWGGLGVRMGDAVTVSAGIEFASIGFSYAYDISTGANLLSPHSHEINLTYILAHKRGFGEGSLSPRRILEKSRLVK